MKEFIVCVANLGKGDVRKEYIIGNVFVDIFEYGKKIRKRNDEHELVYDGKDRLVYDGDVYINTGMYKEVGGCRFWVFNGS